MSVKDVDDVLHILYTVPRIDTYIVYVKENMLGGQTASAQDVYQALYGSLLRRFGEANTKEILKKYMKEKVLPLGEYPFGFTVDEYDENLTDLSKFRSKSKTKSKTRKTKSKTRRSKSKTRK